MQLRELQIDGFGIFSDKRVQGLTSGINVIYGPNEFGKTTILEFIRRILFGFPTRRENVNLYVPANGGKFGGRLRCQMANGETLIISRSEGTHGGTVAVTVDSHEHQGQAALDSFLGHASREIFQNIYAFSLDELQDFQSLRGEEVKNRIYGAGLGLGNVSLGEVEAAFKKRGKELLRARGAARMGVLLNEIRACEQEIRDIQKGLGRYDDLVHRMEKLNEEKSDFQRRIDECNRNRRALEVSKDLFPVVAELIQAQSEFDRLPEIPDFPENGLQTLNTFKRELESLGNRIQDEKETHNSLKNSLGQIKVNEALLAMESDVLFLQQSIQEVRSAIRDQALVRLERESLQDRIQMEIGTISRDWDEEKILKFELTEADKNQIHHFYNTLDYARQQVTSARDKLDLHREQKAAEVPRETPVPGWMKNFSYGLGGFGAVVAVLGGLLVDVVIFGIGLALLTTGGVLYRQICREKPPEVKKDDTLEKNLVERLEQAEKERDGRFEEWRAWLRERHLDASLAPLGTEKIGADIREIKNMISQRARIDDRLKKMQETENNAAALVQSIQKVVPDFSSDSELTVNMELLVRLFHQARTDQERKSLLEKQSQEQMGKIAWFEEQLQKKEQAKNDFIRSSGAAGEKDFIARSERFERRKTLQKQIEEKKGYIQTQVGFDDAYDRFLDSVRTTSPETIDAELSRVLSQLDELVTRKDELIQSLGETRNQVDQLASSDDLIAKQVELEARKHELNDCAAQWAAHRIAQVMLERAKDKYEKERQPEVVRSAEQIFSRVTGGNYRRIIKTLDSEEILIDDGMGKRKEILEMSRGTREQLYLAMRFGLIEEYEKRSEPMPVVMDDVFVNFDDVRGARVVELLAEFARSRQVIVLTCHRRSLEAYAAAGANSVTI